MQQIKQCTELFQTCFPMISMSEKIISEKLKDTDLFFRYDNDELMGFSAVLDNSLLVLCVKPEFQGKGTGTALLAESEEFIRKQGYDRIILGRSSRDFFWGAVIDTMSHRFFEKRGYTAQNGCLSMYLLCEEFSYEEYTRRYGIPEQTEYRIFRESIPDDVAEAVRKVEPKWISHYENARRKTVITAEVSGKTAGFVIADTDARTIVTDDDCRTGLLGYVGVVPEERNRGVGLGMVAFASGYMKSEGCTEIFVNYTSLDGWYSRLGFEDYIWYWMGEKHF